jgi:hypothetical protein
METEELMAISTADIEKAAELIHLGVSSENRFLATAPYRYCI